MTPDALDNPIWSALLSAQAHFAIGGPLAKRYPADVAPFIAVPEPSEAAAAALAELVAPGEIVNIVNVTPRLEAGWELLATGNIVQMVWRPDAATPAENTDGIVPLGATDTADMLALTTLVFPGYFRARTPAMGEYFGIRQDGQLAAMAGERMKLRHYEEISAVCTHTNFLGRGYAARLINLLVAKQLRRGIVPFLHVNETNTRARSLYARLGFSDRATLPLWLLKRV
ncbi:GNAT family N-acetyltransferase [Steroidobacter sp.]|uniref:GNAT family N-acetyltransferase n=1 Tax=Steroidobacter sp. TaxID=1978227 RepID=UPI001A3DD359|nr:GNAT family N-acetyltransferase [Steroidobacter sp.]MBL8265922.1 GNAT family N-acetyltransferase [Steroidobacter sp.]